MKKGDVQASLNKGADTEGGYLTPVEWDRTITTKLVLVSPMYPQPFSEAHTAFSGKPVSYELTLLPKE